MHNKQTNKKTPPLKTKNKTPTNIKIYFSKEAFPGIVSQNIVGMKKQTFSEHSVKQKWGLNSLQHNTGVAKGGKKLKTPQIPQWQER